MKVRSSSLFDDGDTVIIGMITNSQFLGRLAGHWPRQGRFGKSRALNLIAYWCVSYYKKYGHAPDMKIQAIYANWASKGQRDKGEIKQVELILDQLSRTHERNGKDDYLYLCDVAETKFKEIQYRESVTEAEQALDLGDLDRVERAFEKRPMLVAQREWQGLEFGAFESVINSNLFEPLLEYPDPFNGFLASAFTKESFVAIQAGEKVGKSLWLLDIAYRAIKNKQRVAYFEAGDHTASQFKCRWVTRITGLPNRPRPVVYPISLSRESDGGIVIENEERKKDVYGIDSIKRSLDRLTRTAVKDPLRWDCYLAGQLSVDDIKSTLDEWGIDNWKPDVVIVDYADIMALNDRIDRRDGINATWIGLRAISQEFKCLVVTATQADARSYDRAMMSKNNFSEDKRKMAHVTDFIGLMRPQGAVEPNVTKVNFIVRRNEPYSEGACCYVAGCPELGRPVVLSAR